MVSKNEEFYKLTLTGGDDISLEIEGDIEFVLRQLFNLSSISFGNQI